MAENPFYEEHYRVRIMVEAMLNATSSSYSSSPDLSPIRKRSVSPGCRKGEVEILPYERFNGRSNHYSQIADKNARELIKEEEQARLKAEKKKAKKERQKQKKKANLNKYNSNSKNCEDEDFSENKIMKNENSVLNTNSLESEALDVNAAFVTKAVKKTKKKIITPEEPQNKKDEIRINYLIQTALELENKQQYKEALEFLNEAINLSPKEFDLILKRSVIFYKLEKFEISIQDAQKVLKYCPNNIDAIYRIGEGNFSMNNLPEAEAAFTKLLSLNAYTEKCKKRLFSIRLKQLEEMGYSSNDSFTALIKSENKTLDEAIEFLAALENENENKEDIYYSDDEECDEDEDDDSEGDDDSCDSKKGEMEGACGPLVETVPKQTIVIDKKSPLLTDPSNPFQCCSLFVGNLKEDITYKEVQDVFIKFGNIRSIKLATENSCYGFVNFEDSSSAGQAMQALQGSRWLLSTIPLIVRYPTNIVNATLSSTTNTEFLTKINALLSAKQKFTSRKPTPVVKTVSNRPRPLPKTEDCYFWTTTGCVYGDKCFNLHRPEQKGILLNSKKIFPSSQ